MQEFTWYAGDGLTHPLLFLPKTIALNWGGGDKRTGFAPHIDAREDYPALCSITEAARQMLVTVEIEDTPVLVIVGEMRCPTTWLPHLAGGFFIQPQSGGDEKILPRFLDSTDLYRAMDEPDEAWEIHEGGPQEITVVPNSGYLLMNSLDVGPDDPIATEKPLPIEIAPGTYNIKVGRWMPGEESEYLIYRLSRMD